VPGVPQTLSGWGKPSDGPYLNRAAFAASAPFTFGNVGKNLPSVRLPFNYEEDVIISKRTYFDVVREGFNAEFRAEFYNLLNRTVFGGPGNNLNTPQSFGIIGTQGNYRVPSSSP